MFNRGIFYSSTTLLSFSELGVFNLNIYNILNYLEKCFALECQGIENFKYIKNINKKKNYKILKTNNSLKKC